MLRERKSEMRLRRLLIVSGVVHYWREGLLCAYGPYAREIDIWAELFPEIVIAAPLRRGPPPKDALPFSAKNISMAPQLETGGLHWWPKLVQLLALPLHLFRLARAMRRADAIQVRCPANLGLLACVLAPCFNKPRIAKYAGQWKDSRQQPLAWRWQKALLRSKRWGSPVLVYENYPGQPPHIVPIFNSAMTRQQVARAVEVAGSRPLEAFNKVLFVGRLTAERNVDTLLQAIRVCLDRKVHFSCRIVGDGNRRPSLEQETQRLGLGNEVTFTGALPFDRVMDEYCAADILVLVGETEGWGKSIVEGMAFGLVCIGGKHGAIPLVLGEGRGIVVESRNVSALAQALLEVHLNPSASARMSRVASAWAQGYSIESLRDAIRGVVESFWRIRLSEGAPVAA